MDNTYNRYNLEPQFKKWLIAGNVSPQSVKHYLSDFRHFFGWLIFKLKVKKPQFEIEKEKVNWLSFVDEGLIEEYKSYLLENQIPQKTINRRLSTLRKFFSFCIDQGWLKRNPAKQVRNISSFGKRLITPEESLLFQFKKDLEKEGLDQKKIKSYLEEIERFLNFIKNP